MSSYSVSLQDAHSDLSVANCIEIGASERYLKASFSFLDRREVNERAKAAFRPIQHHQISKWQRIGRGHRDRVQDTESQRRTLF
jgi:hypothetical protein